MSALYVRDQAFGYKRQLAEAYVVCPATLGGLDTPAFGQLGRMLTAILRRNIIGAGGRRTTDDVVRYGNLVRYFT